jgi:hypothetical protein
LLHSQWALHVHVKLQAVLQVVKCFSSQVLFLSTNTFTLSCWFNKVSHKLLHNLLY